MSVHLFNKDIPIYNAVLKKCDNRERFCSIKVRCNLIIIKVIVIIIIIEIIITIVIIIIIMLMMIMLMMIIIMEFNNSIFTSIIQIEFGFRHVGFCARRKTGEPGKNPPRKASINNKLNTHERQVWESNPSHKGGRQALIHCATRTPTLPPPLFPLFPLPPSSFVWLSAKDFDRAESKLPTPTPLPPTVNTVRFAKRS